MRLVSLRRLALPLTPLQAMLFPRAGEAAAPIDSPPHASLVIGSGGTQSGLVGAKLP
jgi:hypothetical protein